MALPSLIRPAVVAIVFLLSASQANAMLFSTVAAPNDPSTTIVIATGAIEAGDAERFRDQLSREPPSVPVLGITSPGGNVSAALLLADEIEAQEFSVFGIGECASACAQIIFPAGDFSVLTPGSLLGIHSCSAGGVRNDLCNEEIATAAVRRGFPYGTLDFFSYLYGPTEMKWLSEIGARCFGFYHAPGEPRPIDGPKPCVDGVIYTMNTNAAPRSFGPSFDCAQATTRVERLFCDDKELMLIDSILGRVYDAARSVADQGAKDLIRREQQAWIAERNAECSPIIPENADFRASRQGALCLYRYNAARIYALIDEGTF